VDDIFTDIVHTVA